MDFSGFVDLQVNGHQGVNFSGPDLTKKKVISISKELIARGTAVFLPTVITSSLDTFKRNLPIIAESIEHPDLKQHIPGIHIEGPFISREDGARGAHQAKWVREPDIAIFDKLYEWSHKKLKLLTIAAEVTNAAKLCEYATKKGIVVSLGHQLATEKDLENLASAGAGALTHLGNGIPKTLPRHHNPLWAGMANDNLIAMIITDGHHIPPSIIKTVIRTKGIAKLIVVSDASSLTGLEPGTYYLDGDEAILEESGLLHNPKTGYLVGSSSTMLECMNYLASLNLLSLDELLKVGVYNPLKLIGIDPQSITGPGLQYDEKEHAFSIEH